MFDVTTENTALVITDSQNDFLSPQGATWSLVGESVTENKTVEHIEALFTAAKARGLSTFISPTTTTRATTVGSLRARSKK